MLKKMGHNYSYANNEITRCDENRWKQVSMMERVFYEMPSTTNSLESSHGHLNRKTPRRNNFWTALNRIITFFLPAYVTGIRVKGIIIINIKLIITIIEKLKRL